MRLKPRISSSLLLGGVFAARLAAQQVPTLTRVGEIGCSDCGGPVQFASITDVSVTDSGDVLVVGTEAPTLRMFDRAGRMLWSSGRSGTGPGEYRLPIRAVVGPNGVQVVDMTLRRVTRLDRGGAFVSSAPITGFAASVGARGRTGDLVILLDNFRGTYTLQRWSLSDSGNATGSVPRSAAANAGTLTIPAIAVSPAGEIAYVADPDEYRILRLSPAGERIGEITREVQRVKRTEAEVEALERRAAAARQRATERVQRGGSAPVVPIRPPAADLKPHFPVDGLRYDDSGRLWAKTMRGDEQSTVFDVFSPNGSYLGEVRVKAAIGAFSLGGRWMVADVESGDGTPRVVVFEVR